MSHPVPGEEYFTQKQIEDWERSREQRQSLSERFNEIKNLSEELKVRIKEAGTQGNYCYGTDCDEDHCRCHDDCQDNHVCV